MEIILSQFIFGVQRGIIYALIALGYTMVYGVVRIINFAYGEAFMLGAFCAFFLINLIPLPPGVSILVAFIVPMAFCGVLGIVMDNLAYKPLRKKARLAALITAIGVSFFLNNLVAYSGANTIRTVASIIFACAGLVLLYILYMKLIRAKHLKPEDPPIKVIGQVIAFFSLIIIGSIFWFAKPTLAEMKFKGSDFISFPVENLIEVKQISLMGEVYITNLQIINIVIAIILMVSLSVLVNKTMLGMAMRGCKTNQESIYLMGINVNFIIGITFLIGTALAGAAGVLNGMTYPRITATMGVLPGLKAFIAAVLGGIGSIEGAMVGGLIIGLAEQAAIQFLPSDFGAQHMDFTPLAEGVSFLILIIVLLLRPQGIFGEPPSDKV